MRRRASIGVNLFIVVFTIVAMIMTLTGWGNDFASEVLLVTEGWGNLKFFTVLSNLLSGFACALYLVLDVRRGGDEDVLAIERITPAPQSIPRSVAVLKFAGATSVALTFLTVVVLFHLLWKVEGLFAGANLWFHFVLPLAAIISICFLDRGLRLRLRDTLIATIPMVVYSIGYYTNIVINGIGTPPNTNDWYGLASWGLEWAPVTFAVMFLCTLLMALLIYGIRRLCAARLEVRGR